ncbi:hypothetical protein [Sinorhizobium sojae]|uniref:hypothetical protein n=1 Tax=Sinorhizobium sojae TaxID=716925 RepID=UPI001389D3F8|nr:hypothetical protein [Sinorhizobium sojae]
MLLLATVLGAMNEPARMIIAADAKKIAIDLPMGRYAFRMWIGTGLCLPSRVLRALFIRRACHDQYQDMLNLG